MKVGKPKIKVVVGKAQIQENAWVGKLYKEFLSILNWADLSNYVSKGITNLNVIMGLKSDLPNNEIKYMCN
jgi:hypothetical protein